MRRKALGAVVLLSSFTVSFSVPAATLVGVGRHDVTGPVVGKMFMGHINPRQKGTGLHFRLYSRAFIVGEEGGRRIVFVSADLCHVYQMVKRRVVEGLQARYGSLYDDGNVMLTATHTHVGPAGYAHYGLYDFGGGGFHGGNFDAIVSGIIESIVKAHENLAPGTVSVASGNVVAGNRNRSLEAYLQNPAEERKRYGESTDSLMTVLRLARPDGTPVGAVAWYAVHATSMHREQTVVSGDNKGYASWLFERAMGGHPRVAGSFVAAFANSNAGDVTPGVDGDVDGDGDWECAENDDFLCTEKSGRVQYEKARELFERAGEAVGSGIDYRHSFVSLARISVADAFTKHGEQRTCRAAIGISMLAGAPEDAAGVGKEGVNCSHGPPWAKALCLRDPCHGEKPVVIQMGKKNPPTTPPIVPIQLARLGKLAIVAVPAEFTTMSGRRLRETVARVLASMGVERVVLAGYANAYAGYVATPEEYRVQHYEGASTHFGPWTLPAYQQEVHHLAVAMRDGKPATNGVEPLNPEDFARDREKPLPPDTLPVGRAFGQVERDVRGVYRRGETARAVFWGGNPSHDFLTGSSYLEVIRETEKGPELVAEDWSPETLLRWQKLPPNSQQLIVEWRIPVDARAGRYRLLHRGHYKTILGGLRPYEGTSGAFSIE